VKHWREFPTEAALTAHLARRGAAVRPERPAWRPQVPATPQGLETLLQAIQREATRQGWAGQYTYNAQGPDTGLHVILVREVILFAEVTLDPRLSLPQQHWLDALRTTGQVEVVVWGPDDLGAIKNRLGQPRVKETP
jgi:hypothetical protein